jgi:hypothetical protein
MVNQTFAHKDTKKDKNDINNHRKIVYLHPNLEKYIFSTLTPKKLSNEK